MSFHPGCIQDGMTHPLVHPEDYAMVRNPWASLFFYSHFILQRSLFNNLEK